MTQGLISSRYARALLAFADINGEADRVCREAQVLESAIREVPEIQNGIVTITGIAREAGSRTKMAVSTIDPNVDPVGACVGTRGARVQAVVDELSGEKIDIIPWSENPVQLIANVLSPSDVESVVIESEEDKIATAIVPDNQLSLAIGKQGQNVRLAARVSGWKIDIKSHTQYYTAGEETDIEPEDQE